MCVLLSFPKGLFKDDILNKLLSTETNYKINWVILTITIRISTININILEIYIYKYISCSGNLQKNIQMFKAEEIRSDIVPAIT